jgi:hypothetical protein
MTTPVAVRKRKCFELRPARAANDPIVFVGAMRAATEHARRREQQIDRAARHGTPR